MTSNKSTNNSISLDKLIQPTLLLLIHKKPSHGYELIQNFNSFDPTKKIEPGTIYRNLRKMERDEQIMSKWETSESGPARRQYQITNKGLTTLKEVAVMLEHQKNQIDEFLTLYHTLNEGMANNEG